MTKGLGQPKISEGQKMTVLTFWHIVYPTANFWESIENDKMHMVSFFPYALINALLLHFEDGKQTYIIPKHILIIYLAYIWI